MKTRKVFGLYIGEILLGTACFCGFVAVMMLGINMAIPAWQ